MKSIKLQGYAFLEGERRGCWGWKGVIFQAGFTVSITRSLVFIKIEIAFA